MKTPKQSDTKAERIWHDFLIKNIPSEIQTSKGIEIFKIFREQKREAYLYAAVRSCSDKKYSMEETVKVLRQYFGYILPDDFDVECFKEMLFVPQISDAYNSGLLSLNDYLVQDKALQLALKTGSLQDLESYVKMYGTTLRVAPESEPDEGTSKPQQQITFKLSAS